MLSKGLLIFLLVGTSIAQDYSTEDRRAVAQQLAPNYVRPTYSENAYDDAKAEPYDFSFSHTDEFGTVMNRQEASDNSGAVRGSYGYTDPFGVFRHVDYVADEYGFRAHVKSNEPGMGSQSPANVDILAEPPPAGVVVERPIYTNQIPRQSNPPQTQVQPPRRIVVPVNANRQNRQAAVAGSSSQSSLASTSSAASSASSSASGAGSRATLAGAGPFPYAPAGQSPYGSAGQSPYGSAGQNPYGSGRPISSEFQTPIARYGGPNPYPSTTRFLPTGADRVFAPQTTAAVPNTNAAQTTASSSSAADTATVYRYPPRNPYLTNVARVETDKDDSGTVLLPTVVTSGGPTLVKHIHTYPVTSTQ